MQGCAAIGKTLSVPDTAILFGLMSIVSFMLAHSSVKCVGTRWTEPVILWMVVAMPTGSGKSTIFRFLLELMKRVRSKCGRKDSDPSWTMDETSFEKMGAMMAENDGRLLGIHDELSSFLTSINLYNSKGLSESRDMNKFLELYCGFPWKRRTGTMQIPVTPSYLVLLLHSDWGCKFFHGTHLLDCWRLYSADGCQDHHRDCT